MQQQSQILLGYITGAHGLKGEVRVRSYTTQACDIASYGDLHLEDNQILQVSSVRFVQARDAIIRFRNIDDRNQSEQLKGAKLFVHRAQLPELPDDEYYLSDLMNMEVQNQSQSILGHVCGIENYGASDILEIKSTKGDFALVPLIDDAVLNIDFEDRRMIVNPAFIS